jgi:hypothetical protein
MSQLPKRVLSEIRVFGKHWSNAEARKHSGTTVHSRETPIGIRMKHEEGHLDHSNVCHVPALIVVAFQHALKGHQSSRQK